MNDEDFNNSKGFVLLREKSEDNLKKYCFYR